MLRKLSKLVTRGISPAKYWRNALARSNQGACLMWMAFAMLLLAATSSLVAQTPAQLAHVSLTTEDSQTKEPYIIQSPSGAIVDAPEDNGKITLHRDGNLTNRLYVEIDCSKGAT